MNTASVFDWFARDSLRAAQETNDPKQCEMWIRLAELWAPPRDGAATTERRRRRTLRNGAVTRQRHVRYIALMDVAESGTPPLDRQALETS
jgi:hypothetical protein